MRLMAVHLAHYYCCFILCTLTQSDFKDATYDPGWDNLPSTTSTHRILPPFSRLTDDILEEYVSEFVHRFEQFMNGELGWYHVGLSSCARGRMHPEGVFVVDGFSYRERDVHSLFEHMRHLVEPGLTVIRPVNATVLNDHTLSIELCLAFSLSVDIVSWTGSRTLTVCGSQTHMFDDVGWLIRAEGTSMASTVGYIFHYLYSATSTLLPQYREPPSDPKGHRHVGMGSVESGESVGTAIMDANELGIWLILPQNPFVFLLLVCGLTSSALIGVCILCTFHRVIWRPVMTPDSNLRFVYDLTVPTLSSAAYLRMSNSLRRMKPRKMACTNVSL